MESSKQEKNYEGNSIPSLLYITPSATMKLVYYTLDITTHIYAIAEKNPQQEFKVTQQ
jgi:hypothetical protein